MDLKLTYKPQRKYLNLKLLDPKIKFKKRTKYLGYIFKYSIIKQICSETFSQV